MIVIITNVKFFIKLSFIIATMIILSDTGIILSQHKKEFPSVGYSKIKIMSCQYMVSLTGGTAGGGTCSTYTGSCDPGCTKLSASNCQGSVGSCSNDFHIPACLCKSIIFYIHGCM